MKLFAIGEIAVLKRDFTSQNNQGELVTLHKGTEVKIVELGKPLFMSTSDEAMLVVVELGTMLAVLPVDELFNKPAPEKLTPIRLDPLPRIQIGDDISTRLSNPKFDGFEPTCKRCKQHYTGERLIHVTNVGWMHQDCENERLREENTMLQTALDLANSLLNEEVNRNSESNDVIARLRAFTDQFQDEGLFEHTVREVWVGILKPLYDALKKE